MNPRHIGWNIIPIVISALGLLVALCLGLYIGGGDIVLLALLAGSAAIIALIAGMRQHIWLLVPMFWGFTGFVHVLPLPFSVRDLVVMLVAAVGFALLALRVFRFRNRWDLLDFILLLNLGQVFMAFLLHPVGLRALSSQTVGARPYFNIAIAVLAYVILSNQIISPKLGRLLPVVMLIPEAFLAVLTLVVRAKPGLGLVLGYFYSGLFPQLAQLSPDIGRVERVGGIVGSGNGLLTALCSYFRPLTLINPFRPIRFVLLVVGIILVLISGFRSALLSIAAIFLISSYLRKGLTDVLTVLAGMFLAVLALVVINSAVYPLPLAVQRTLSFLPGQWDSRAVADATGSTEWRVQMWRDIPKSGQYIHNKVMGDGFGFSRDELQAIQRQAASAGGMQQEDFMLTGSFHNGPLSAIRFVGVVGMCLYYALLIYAAMYGWRLIRASEHSDFYPLTLFISLSLIWEPVNYTFVFGGYDSGLPHAIFGVGMLKMIYNSLEHSAQKTARATPAPLAVAHGEPVLR
jgi:hypothetical protein